LARVVRIPAALWDQLLRQGRAALPAEACWALGGDSVDGALQPQQAVPLQNRAGSGDAFTADAADFARAEQQLRAAGRRWLGFAHTHPAGTARLSQADERELWRHCLQLVLGLPLAGPPTIAAFWLRADGVDALPLEY
jgi:proteasome lid subunit RPN8/RPN11